MGVRQRVLEYASDPLIGEMWAALRKAPPMRSISVDVTHRCNLRCTGCYFFAEKMDRFREADGDRLQTFIEEQKRRGITFATVIGGEPALVPDRLRALAEHFNLMIVTNGLRAIPREGLENVAIAVSVWGDKENDRELRGYGRIDIFQRALRNFENDPRVIWYITLPSEPRPETEEVVDECVRNGNLVGFNFYGDLTSLGGIHDHGHGFAGAREFVLRMIERHPGHVAFNRYLNTVISKGELKGERWGYEVCGSISVDDPVNAERLRNGNSYNPHFNAYMPDLASTRRCCVGEDRDCSTCYDVWSHVSWVAMNMERHLDTREDFFHWLSTMYIFYAACRLVDAARFRELLPRIHAWAETGARTEARIETRIEA